LIKNDVGICLIGLAKQKENREEIALWFLLPVRRVPKGIHFLIYSYLRSRAPRIALTVQVFFLRILMEDHELINVAPEILKKPAVVFTPDAGPEYSLHVSQGAVNILFRRSFMECTE